MGNTCKRCFGIRSDSRKFIRAKYTMTKDFSIEFENLVEEDVPEDIVRRPTRGLFGWHRMFEKRRPVTEHEKRLVKKGMLFQLVTEQARRDMDIDDQLAAQEEALKMEEEAYYAERRAAAATARRTRLGPRSPALAVAEDPLRGSPLPRSDWSDVELDDDPSAVPASLTPPSRARKSLKQEMEEEERRASTSGATNRVLHQRLNQGYCSDTEFELGYFNVAGPDEILFDDIFDSDSTLLEGFGDFQSVSSGREASIDLDWDHEPGMNPALAEGMERSATEEDLTRLATCSVGPGEVEVEDCSTKEGRADSPASLVWENDFSMDVSRRHLLAEDT